MSAVAQRRKGPKIKQLACFNGGKFKSKEEAREFRNKLINRGRRGAKGLGVYKCNICSNKQGDIFHVGRLNRKVKQ